jgi:hypothetical protein
MGTSISKKENGTPLKTFEEKYVKPGSGQGIT